MTWAILPCTRSCFNKNKVTMSDIRTFWESGSIIVVENVDTKKLTFVVSAGGGMGYDIGDVYHAKHDQTRQTIGLFRVLNEVAYETRNGKLHITSHLNATGFQASAPVYCFK